MAQHTVSTATLNPAEGDWTRRAATAVVVGLALTALISFSVWVLADKLPAKIALSDNMIANFCQYLSDSNVGTGIRESLWVFPIIEGTHLLGIAISVGMLCWFDLRLLGLAFTDEPVSKVWKQVMPTAIVGFIVMFISGFLLFWAEAATAYQSIHFWLKMALVLVAGLNALIFETTQHTAMAPWDNDVVPPFRARLTGFLSLFFWTAVIVTGRTMAYNF